MVYAYVRSETCTRIQAVLPGEHVDDERVSRHGDFEPWRHGKTDTQHIAVHGVPLGAPRPSAGNAARYAWERRSAAAVLDLLGWRPEGRLPVDGKYYLGDGDYQVEVWQGRRPRKRVRREADGTWGCNVWFGGAYSAATNHTRNYYKTRRQAVNGDISDQIGSRGCVA